MDPPAQGNSGGHWRADSVIAALIAAVYDVAWNDCMEQAGLTVSCKDGYSVHGRWQRRTPAVTILGRKAGGLGEGRPGA